MAILWIVVVSCEDTQNKERGCDMNKQALKGLIVANDGSQKVLAEAMGLSLSRFNAKLNEQGGEFTKSEIEFIRDRYKMSRKQVMDIFFTKTVS